MKKTIFAVLGLIWAPVSADAQQFSADDLTFRIVQRRAVEAVIWGMPAVNYDLMLQEMLKLGGKANQIVYWSGLPDWKNQTLTPNPDAIYLMPFIQHQGRRAGGDRDTPGRRRVDHRHHHGWLADAAGGRRSRGRRRWQGREIRGPAAELH